jgi:HSP20 family protein
VSNESGDERQLSWNDPFRRRSRRNRASRGNADDADPEDDWQSPFDFDFSLGFGEIDKMIESMFRTAMSQAKDASGGSGPMYYGYSVNVGPDGKPHVREFGNVRPAGQGRIEVGSREPFVDTVLDEKNNELKVIAEMPGVQKEDINLEVLGNSLRIRAEHGDRKYESTVPLRPEIDSQTAKAMYNNGVLEVTMKLKSAVKPKGISIRVD